MSDSLYIFTLVLIAATCVLIFGIRAWAAYQSARNQKAREEAYGDLAAQCAAAQSASAAHLGALQSEQARTSSRLAGIEVLLKSVE